MRNILLILALAAFWCVSGIVVGYSLNALFDGAWVAPCASLNVIAGMLLLLFITRNEQARRIFYEGPRANESGLILLAFLWAIPVILLFLGILWWLLAQFLR